ncbi:MAG TPA: hypothetical protein VMB82_13420 [Acidimicrobiales bacterium]|nr:hypothetical protein [Acidimicrobiales bacterium]
MRTVRILLALATALAAALGVRALLARSQEDGREPQRGVMDRWPPVPRKPESDQQIA